MRARSTRWLALGLAAAFAVSALGGCVARPAVYGYDAEYVDGPYADVYASQSVYWNGGYAYWHGDNWWYRHDGRWVVLRSEPRDLYRHRTGRWGVQRPYAGGRVYRAPPAHRSAPRGAPPAGRGGGPRR
jgi:hypothetical protein